MAWHNDESFKNHKWAQWKNYWVSYLMQHHLLSLGSFPKRPAFLHVHHSTKDCTSKSAQQPHLQRSQLCSKMNGLVISDYTAFLSSFYNLNLPHLHRNSSFANSIHNLREDRVPCWHFYDYSFLKAKGTLTKRTVVVSDLLHRKHTGELSSPEV